MTAKLPKPRMIKPLELKRDSVIEYMRNLRQAKAYEVLCGLQGIELKKILDEGVRTKRPEQWSVLEGFYRAVGLVDVWANKEISQPEQEEQGD